MMTSTVSGGTESAMLPHCTADHSAIPGTLPALPPPHLSELFAFELLDADLSERIPAKGSCAVRQVGVEGRVERLPGDWDEVLFAQYMERTARSRPRDRNAARTSPFALRSLDSFTSPIAS